MALTQIKTEGISANAITADKISSTVALGGPKISNTQVANSSWSVLDDTAVDTAGGYIIINGSGFVSGCRVLFNTTSASAVTFSNSSVLRVTVPALAANSYVIYVINPDGGTAIGADGITSSVAPAWVTASALANASTNTAYSYQLTATGATSYALQAGSSLPANSTLASNGLFSGNTNVASNTAYSFTIVATDAELQDSPRTFSLNINNLIEEPYWANTILLLNGNGSNTGTTITDSSSYGYTFTIGGNTNTRTDIKKYGTASLFFDGSGDYLVANGGSTFNLTGVNFTIEAWVYMISGGSQYMLFNSAPHQTLAISLNRNGGGDTHIYIGNGSTWLGVPAINASGGNSLSLNTWQHVALVRNGGTITLYHNGTNVGTTSTVPSGFTGAYWIGAGVDNIEPFHGYMDDFRITKGVARYTSNFTPPNFELAQYLP